MQWIQLHILLMKPVRDPPSVLRSGRVFVLQPSFVSNRHVQESNERISKFLKMFMRLGKDMLEGFSVQTKRVLSNTSTCQATASSSTTDVNNLISWRSNLHHYLQAQLDIATHGQPSETQLCRPEEHVLPNTMCPTSTTNWVSPRFRKLLKCNQTF